MTSLVNKYKVIVNKSTVPVGTADKVGAIFFNAGFKAKANTSVLFQILNSFAKARDRNKLYEV